MTDYSSEDFWKGAPEASTHYQPPRAKGCNPVFWMVKNGVPVEAWEVISGGKLHHISNPRYEEDVFDKIIPRPAQPCSGDGLPPVGTFVRITDDGSLYYGRNESGEVIAHVEDCAVVRMSYGLGCFTARFLEAIKTPAQIAAEERDAAIGRMRECFDSVSDDLCPTSNQYLETLFGALHDAGYRLTAGDDK